MDERVWLYLPETKGYFHCPIAAADAWKARGWRESEPPIEPDPVLAEYQPLAQPQAELAADPDAGPTPPAETKTKRRAADKTNAEGVNDVA